MYIHTHKWLEWLLYVHPHTQMAGVVALCTSTQTNGWSGCFMYIHTNKWLEWLLYVHPHTQMAGVVALLPLLYVHPHKQMAGVVALCTSTQTNGWSGCFMYIHTNKWLE